ncbi:MAG: hypothetical protein WBB01_01510 [Phormidesmis sp.]
MFGKLLPTATLAGTIGLVSLTTALTAPASAQEVDYQQVMRADNFSLWNSGEMSGIAFDVWRRPAASGGGFYYFLWQGQYGRVADTGDPEVVVFFDSNMAQLKSEFLTDCYNAPTSSDTCLNPDRKPAHYRFDGPCIFPWQTAANGTSCGGRAAISRPGSF